MFHLEKQAMGCRMKRSTEEQCAYSLAKDQGQDFTPEGEGKHWV